MFEITDDMSRPFSKEIFTNQLKGGPGSGSWEGPGKRRFRRTISESSAALDRKRRADALAKLKEEYARRSGKGSTVAQAKPKDPMSKARDNWKDVSEQMDKNLSEIAEGTAKHVDVDERFSPRSIEAIISNMHSEADLYSNYLASDTAVKLRDFISTYKSLMYEGGRKGEFKKLNAQDFDAFGIDSVRKLVHQEIESNRQQFTDHGIRHIEGNIARQIEIMKALGRTTNMDKLSAMAIMVNHDMGYTTAAVRSGGKGSVSASKSHRDTSGEMFDDQKSVLDEGKLFTSKEFRRLSTAIKTHDSTDISKDNLLNSTRLSDNLALFATDKLPSMFRYVKGGDKDLLALGEAAKVKDNTAFISARTKLWKKIDSSGINENLKRDLKAATNKISYLTPKFSMGVLAGSVDSISRGKGKTATVVIRYNEMDSKLQKMFDMGQNQTKKLLKDYGITDYSKTEYDLKIAKIKVVGAPASEPVKTFDTEEEIRKEVLRRAVLKLKV